MAFKARSVTAARVRELFEYDPESGRLSWRAASVLRGRQHRAGDRAGTSSGSGRRQVCVDGVVVKEHRVIWLHAHGALPLGDIDHINGDPSDNRLSNLRDVPRSVNIQNQRRQRKGAASGFLGVWMDRERFVASIAVDGRSLGLGTYDTPEEASAAYIQAKRLLHPGCTI